MEWLDPHMLEMIVLFIRADKLYIHCACNVASEDDSAIRFSPAYSELIHTSAISMSRTLNSFGSLSIPCGGFLRWQIVLPYL